MRLAEILVSDLQRAIDLYVAIAFDGAPCPRAPRLDAAPDDPVEAVLPPRGSGFVHEPAKPPRKYLDEYVLQLGNSRYPLMKLVLGEYLMSGEYFLSIDTHDWMFRPDASDPEEQRQWEETLRHNSALKERIERCWNEANLPTLHDFTKSLSSAQVCAVHPRGQRILIVDDDRTAARALAAFLGSRGFDIDLAHDGVEALAVADPTRHQLVVLDVDMPNMDGLEACACLKADARRRALPVLLTSRRGGLGDHPPAGADAFLLRPFPADVLLYFLENLLRK